MKLKAKNILNAINKAYRKEKINRTNIELFKSELNILISKIDKKESEEHLKYPLRDFLKNTFYQNNEINTKGRTDLAIYSGATNKTSVNIIFETKKPSNISDMITSDNLNKKALHETVLYYIREREEENNNDIKQIIITNLYEWFIFDALDFERVFYTKAIINEYQKWKSGQKTSKNTELFYNEIVKPFIAENNIELDCILFDIREYKKSEHTIVLLHKVLSAEHLLKLPFANDSNTLNRQFYNELLHIIGLEEIKENGKKIIKRKSDYHKYTGSLLENAITSIETENRISKVSNVMQYGNNQKEQIFNIALELTITWINRILFLKLLEAQLVRYHKNNENFLFLNAKFISDFDELNELFFEVLAKKNHERKSYLQEKFLNVPYLNSSLFEISELEDECIRINSLKSRFTLNISNATILKSSSGQKKTGELNISQYLFDFLNAYDFSSDSVGEIQEENKTLINASVLGLIFEKLNGYKEGAFFTPGFITMYICRETIRRTVIQKFKNAGYILTDNLELSASFDELRDKIQNTEEANNIINSLKICDPAVGSGHFLVSALNEIISIKSDLRILRYRNGHRIKYYTVEIENDDLIITDEETSEIFEYFLSVNNKIIKERQELQETIFHEKQIIIENCLFGVDINANSVNICRLRLWIELLKNAYYTAESNYSELETLPNIDINIKQGNSLVSRFALNGNGLVNGQSQKIKLATEKYKQQVIIYKSTNDKKTKKNAENEIIRLKKEFAAVANPTDKDYLELKEKQAELGQAPLTFTQEDKEKWQKKVERLTQEVTELEIKYKSKLQTIYGNAFEWRFKFPEVLDDNGKFIGFDAIIGNPPYYQIQYAEFDFKAIKERYCTYEETGDIYSLFIELACKLSRPLAQISYIVSNRFCNTNYGHSTRKFLAQYVLQTLININNIDVFEEANVSTLVFSLKNYSIKNNIVKIHNVAQEEDILNLNKENIEFIPVNQKYFNEKQWIFDNEITLAIKNKMDNNGIPFIKSPNLKINRGITTGANKYFVINKAIRDKLINSDKNNSDIIKPLLKGKDIKRFTVLQHDNWIVFTRRGIEIDTYPAIKKYLSEFKTQLSPGLGRKKGIYKWFEIQDNTSFYKNFEKEKLIWTRLSNINSFAISTNNEYSIDSTSFATGENLKYYCAVLNSKAIYFYFKLGSVIWGKNGIKWFGEYFDNIPIPIASDKEKNMLENLTEQIIEKKNINKNCNTVKLEKQIDTMVYKLYKLTKKEIQHIEKATA